MSSGPPPPQIVVSSPTGFAVSFEDAAAAFERLERLYFEPDGSFVWAEDAWQIDGLLVDHAGRVQYLELKGIAPIEAFEQLFSALGWPETSLAFQLVREGRQLDEAAFREWLNNSA